MSDLGMTVGLIKALAPEPEVDPADVTAAVDDWLDDHPEATTTVTDGSITRAKLASGLEGDLKAVEDTIKALHSGYTINGYIAANGALSSSDNYRCTDFIECDSKTVISLVGVWTGTSALGYAFYSDKKETAFISGQNNVQTNTLVTSIPNNAKYFRSSSRISNGEKPVAVVASYIDALKKINDLRTDMDAGLSEKLSVVEPKNTTFFKGVNYFDPLKAVFYTDRFVDTNGQIKSSSGVSSLSFAVKPSTKYILEFPGTTNRGIIGESADNDFSLNVMTTPIYTSGNPGNSRYIFTTGATARYVIIYFNAGTYDYDTNKTGIILNENEYTGNAAPFIADDNLPAHAANPLTGAKVLVFGDSITDTCNFTIDANDCTSAMTWRNPSNSYTPPGGTLINYSMWPKILKDTQRFAEIRNYARQGASYKTSTRASGEERQNLHYQITVALNDKDNPNNVFAVDDFVPDIVIFALGTNDGLPNDTYSSAMGKTVYQEDGYSIDVEATIAALDESNFCESARKAFIRIKQAFPMAQIYCMMPIQRANNNLNLENLRTELSNVAGRYGCIIIDMGTECGIIREFNTWNANGEYLKDGLHPNEKGQNLMARAVMTALWSHYVPFTNGFNV